MAASVLQNIFFVLKIQSNPLRQMFTGKKLILVCAKYCFLLLLPLRRNSKSRLEVLGGCFGEQSQCCCRAVPSAD